MRSAQSVCCWRLRSIGQRRHAPLGSGRNAACPGRLRSDDHHAGGERSPNHFNHSRGHPSDLVVRVISSPLTMPSLRNVAGLPPMSTLTLKETLSPTTLPSFSGKGSPPGPVTVPVSFSPSCLKAYVRVNGLSQIG